MTQSKNFNAIVFTGDLTVGNNGFITYHKQTSYKRLEGFLDIKYPNWKWVTLYDRKTNDKQLIRRGSV